MPQKPMYRHPEGVYFGSKAFYVVVEDSSSNVFRHTQLLQANKALKVVESPELSRGQYGHPAIDQSNVRIEYSCGLKHYPNNLNVETCTEEDNYYYCTCM